MGLAGSCVNHDSHRCSLCNCHCWTVYLTCKNTHTHPKRAKVTFTSSPTPPSDTQARALLLPSFAHTFSSPYILHPTCVALGEIIGLVYLLTTPSTHRPWPLFVPLPQLHLLVSCCFSWLCHLSSLHRSIPHHVTPCSYTRLIKVWQGFFQG